MNMDHLTGTYTEVGTWYTTTGERGTLSGTIVVATHATGITFRYGDGSEHGTSVRPVTGSHAALAGSAGAGTLYIGSAALVLEYHADVNGRPEENTDSWIRADGEWRRAGVIRQPARMIWYEAVMVPGD
jgi:hypothetical protein